MWRLGAAMTRAAIATAVLLSVAFPAIAPAAPNGGSQSGARLDSTFGLAGRAFIPLHFKGPLPWWNPKMTASMPDGGLVVSNRHVLKRLTPSGRRDYSFGSLGVLMPMQSANESFEIDGLAVDSQGRIVVAGTATLPPEERAEREFGTGPLGGFGTRPLDVVVDRYLPDGSLDSSFGTHGVVETDLGLAPPRDQNGQPSLKGFRVQATGVAVDSQDRIVLTGGASVGVDNSCSLKSIADTLTYAGFIARFTEQGALDPSFGGDGVVGGESREENALSAESTATPVPGPGGQLSYMSGGGPCPGNQPRPGVAVVSEAGDPQATLGGGQGASGYPDGDTFAPNGSVLTFGSLLRRTGPLHGWVKRWRPGGGLDPSFGTGGSASLVLRGGPRTSLSAIATDAAGRILVGGSIEADTSRLFFERLTRKGKPDAAIGPRGRMTLEFRSLKVGPPTLLIDPQGRVLIVSKYRGRKKGVEGLVAARFTAE